MLASIRQARRVRAALAFIAFGLALGARTPGDARASASGVVISAVYGGGGNSGATYTHDYVELFNAGAAAVPLNGWSLQYASSAGTFNAGGLTPLPDVTLLPGQYYLVQQAQGAGGTQPLPTPDAADNTAMSATAGKVALVSNATLITGAPDPDVVDFVGYGGASEFEGGGPAPTLANPNAAFRAANGCTDTDNNNADFAAAAAFPNARSSASPLAPCGGGDAAPSVVATSPVDGANGVGLGASLTIEFSEDVDVAGAWFEIACTSSGAHTAAVSGGPSVFTLDPDADFAGGESCTVTVFGAAVTDLDPVDPPDAMAADHLFTFETAAGCGAPADRIHEVQGSGAASPLAGTAVTIEGVVVGDFQGASGLSGFFVQEEDGDADGDPATSEGLFVFDGAAGTPVSLGDRVRVSGTVTEFNGLTELTSLTGVDVCAAGQSVTPATVSLPFASATAAEPFEGMAVVVPQTLTVSEVFSLGRFGEVLLSSGGRLMTPTNVAAPGAPAIAQQAANDLNRLILDDGSSLQNPDPTPFLFDDPATPAADRTLRLGSTVTGLAGAMHFAFGSYRIQPVGAPAFVPANPRPVAPPAVGGTVTVAATNVLNYFNGDGAGGGFPTSRGADTPAEFARQRAKTIASLLLIDADVTGLMEVENDSTAAELAAIEDLVDGLNAAAGAGTFAFVDTDVIGTDEIRVALLYKPAAVAPVGTTAVLETGTFATHSRPPIAQAFEDNATGERFVVVVNHFKSKGCGGATGLDLDQGDGQSCFNATRVQSANELSAWLATDPTGTGETKVLIIGDLNSYLQEDPIQALEAAGFVNGIEQQIGTGAYSFAFQGQSGALDHAMPSAALAPFVSGIAELHTSADEPGVLDYNLEFKSAAQQALETGTPYRAADHDALVIGLAFEAPPEPELQNGGFEVDEDGDRLPDGWSGSGFLLHPLLDGRDCHVAREGDCSFRFLPSLWEKRLSQSIALGGQAGDALNLGYWAKTQLVTALVKGRAQVVFQRADGRTTAVGRNLPTGTRGFTSYTLRAVAPHDYVSVRVEFVTQRLLGVTWIDDVTLVRE
jgi:predicted extracellular nuclease